MSSTTQNLRKALIASIGVVALVFAGASAAGADSRHKRHGAQTKKVVVHHHYGKNRKQALREYYRARPWRPSYQPPRKRVVHVYHHTPAPVWRPAPVWTPSPVIYQRTNTNTGTGSISGQTGGMLLGGLVGALAGSQMGKGSGKIVALIGGTVIGAVIGGELGRSMDHKDHVNVQNTLETAPTGRTTEWKNPDSGSSYTVTPTRTYTRNNRPCRDYEAWVFIDGYEQKVTGTACRMADGSWQKV